jgi:hypothetical protein
MGLNVLNVMLKRIEVISSQKFKKSHHNSSRVTLFGEPWLILSKWLSENRTDRIMIMEEYTVRVKTTSF